MGLICVTRRIPEPGLEVLRDSGAEVTVLQSDEEAGVDRDRLLAAVAGCDVLVPLLTEAVDRELLMAGERLLGVAQMAVGYDNVDVEAATELGIPVFVTTGVPGPRVPLGPQKVERLDEVCWLFPELKIVMRHGAEPWEDLAVKLMLKWPNLYYSTSAFAPRWYPKAIIDYANTRGADKILYAGYFPIGLTLDRIFGEMPLVPFRDHVWPKFLRDNAIRVLGLETGGSRPSSAPVPS